MSHLPDRAPHRGRRGRRSTYTREAAERVIMNLCSGAGIRLAAEAAGTHARTVAGWCELVPALRTAVAAARARAIVDVARALHGYATGAVKGAGPSVRACRLFLAARDPETWALSRARRRAEQAMTALAEPALSDAPIPGDTPDGG